MYRIFNIFFLIFFILIFNISGNTFCYKLTDRLKSEKFFNKVIRKIEKHKFNYGSSVIRELEDITNDIKRLKIEHVLEDFSYSENYYFVSKFNYKIMNELQKHTYLEFIHFDLISKFNKVFKLVAISKHLGTTTLLSEYIDVKKNVNIIMNITSYVYSMTLTTNTTFNYLPCSHGLIIPFNINEYGNINFISKRNKDLSTAEALSYIDNDIANKFLYITNNNFY